MNAFAFLVLASPAWSQQSDVPAEVAARIDRLIQQLDEDKFEIREKAEADLAAIGEPALAKLTVAAKDASAERSQRAAKIVAQIRSSGLGLRPVSSAGNPGMLGAVTVALSPDDRFVYVPAWKSTLNILRRDAVTGALEHQGAIPDAEQWGGFLVARLSPNGKLAVAIAFNTKAIVLFLRNAESGQLAHLSARASDPAEGLTLVRPTDVIFSTDGKFVYAVDDSQAAVVVFEVVDGKRLRLVESFEGPGRCFDGARVITAHPDNKTLYVTGFRAGTLCILDRDPASGKVGLRQVLTDEQDGIRGLAGAMSSLVSRDGKFVYTTSGRFAGDNSVGVYQVGDDGKLTVLQEFINDQGDLKDFTGGNQLALSSDESHLYASGTTSCSLACFRRDPATGKLTYTTTIRSEATGAGTTLGANGIACSKDGRFLYLGLEDGGAVSVFEHSQPKP
jgi:6-phosphogluconolactonase (cycloisomerase 2 family)